MKRNIALRMAAVLLCLTLISVQLLSGMLARYTTQGSGSDEARVAGFGQLKLVETTTDYKIIPGTYIKKDPAVSMTKSEVAVRIYVDITPTTTGWTSTQATETTLSHAWFTITLAQGWKCLNPGTATTYTFYYDLPAGSELNDYSVFRDDKILARYDIPYADYYAAAEALNLTISARAEQID